MDLNEELKSAKARAQESKDKENNERSLRVKREHQLVNLKVIELQMKINNRFRRMIILKIGAFLTLAVILFFIGRKWFFENVILDFIPSVAIFLAGLIWSIIDFCITKKREEASLRDEAIAEFANQDTDFIVEE